MPGLVLLRTLSSQKLQGREPSVHSLCVHLHQGEEGGQRVWRSKEKVSQLPLVSLSGTSPPTQPFTAHPSELPGPAPEPGKT